MVEKKNHQRPPFRAEHLGSLLRPQKLVDKRVALDGQKAVVIANDKELHAIEDEAINEIVKLQLDLGFHAVNDGEYRRHQFWGTFFPALEGMEEIEDPPLDMFRLYVPDLAAFSERSKAHIYRSVPAVSQRSKLTIFFPCSGGRPQAWRVYRLCGQDQACREHLPAPEWYHLRYQTGRAYPKDVYANDEEYFADIAKAYHAELQVLYDAGCRNVTIDDPNLAYFCSEKMLQGFKDAGEDSDALLNSYIKLYNDCISSRPDDMHLGIHLCRGNFAYSRHFSEGGYDRIATKLFSEINADTYFLEYDTERAGGFEPLQELPPYKNVVLGVITSKFPELEDLEKMREKVYQAADFVAKGAGQTREEALKRIGVSPQCGFASHHLGNSVTRDDMIAKLKLVRDLADSIWPGEP